MSEVVFTDVAAVGDVLPGAILRVEVGGRPALVCNVDGRLYCVANRCTHAAWVLDEGPLVGSELCCTLHGGRFDVRSGRATARPATKALEVFEIRCCDERIEVRLPPR